MAQHQFDQRSGRTEQRYAEISLWQHTNIWPLVLDFLCDPHGNSTSFGEITLKARENLTERLKAARKQTMWVPILGSTGARSRGCCQPVAFENLDLLKIWRQGAGHRQPADSRSNDYRALA
jgi:hypothetical protein